MDVPESTRRTWIKMAQVLGVDSTKARKLLEDSNDSFGKIKRELIKRAHVIYAREGTVIVSRGKVYSKVGWLKSIENGKRTGSANKGGRTRV